MIAPTISPSRSPQFPAPENHVSGGTPEAEWSRPLLFGFRVAFVSLGFFSVTWFIGKLPLIGSLLDKFPWWMYFAAGGRASPLSSWLITHVLGLPPHSTGGPAVYSLREFVAYASLIAFGLISATIWTLVAQSTTNHRRLYAWLYGVVRFALAAIMFDYGWGKLLPYQFHWGRIPLTAVVEPLGQIRPQGLLWSYMGYSRSYCIFAGAGEFLGSVLLCFRRTATAGALLLIVVLSNVVWVNYAYGVPVQLFATVLLMMAGFIALRDGDRIWLLLADKDVPKSTKVADLFDSAAANRIFRWSALGLALWFAFRPLHDDLRDIRDPKYALPPVFGIYERVHATAMPDGNGFSNWQTVVFEQNETAVRTAENQWLNFAAVRVDTEGHRLTIAPTQKGGRAITLGYSSTPIGLALRDRGEAGANSEAEFRKVPLDSFPLMRSYAHWSW